MKILIVNNYFSLVGGAEIIAYKTYEILKKKGHDVYFWASDRKPYIEEGYRYEEYFTSFNGGLKSYLKNPLKYYINNTACSDLRLFIEKIKPDLIHYHCIDTLTYKIINNSKKIPSIMTIHDASIICPPATLMLKNKKQCKHQLCKKNNYINCILNKCAKGQVEPSIRKAIFTYINNKKLKYIDRFITPSTALKEKVINSNIKIERKNIYVINNFISEDERHREIELSNQKYFLYVGRLVSIKGVNILLQAMKDLPKEIKLHIVGTGPEENKLKQYAKENELHNVEFLGFKTGEDVKNEYQNCIASILPCNGFEIFGMTNIESFINGKPVIASNIGGIPEIVEHNVNGLLFEPANVEQLKECILKYWKNPELVIEHGKNGYKKTITQYTEERYYKELIKLYEETIDEYKKK